MWEQGLCVFHHNKASTWKCLTQKSFLKMIVLPLGMEVSITGNTLAFGALMYPHKGKQAKHPKQGWSLDVRGLGSTI